MKQFGSVRFIDWTVEVTRRGKIIGEKRGREGNENVFSWKFDLTARLRRVEEGQQRRDSNPNLPEKGNTKMR